MWPLRTRSVRSIAIGSGVLAVATIGRRRMLCWGATDDEVLVALAGDDIIGRADLVSTRAVTINSPPDAVWPWIVQLGQGRGGFYTYDALENLVGVNIHSAETIVHDWQHLGVGDEVNLAPEVALNVAQIEQGRSLVLRGGVQMGKVPAPYDFTWAFVLTEVPGGSTRLLVRERYGYIRGWARLLVEPTEVISFVMSQRMLRGIKERAERRVPV